MKTTMHTLYYIVGTGRFPKLSDNPIHIKTYESRNLNTNSVYIFYENFVLINVFYASRIFYDNGRLH